MIARVIAALLGAASAACLIGCGEGSSRAGTPPDAPASTKPALPGTGKPLVTIGDKNFTEQFVLGELYEQALSAQGYSVVLNRNIGPTEVTLPALLSNRLAMYPEYLGTWDSTIAGDRRSFHTARAALRAGRRYAHQHGLELLHPTPFSDTGAVAVTAAYALEHGLHTIRDLRKVAPNLTLGAPLQFQQGQSGLSVLEQAYGLVPAHLKPLDIGSQYAALDQGVVQAAEVNSTDGQLESGNYVLLRDPLRVFGWGQVVPVVSAKALAAEGPAFARTINRVSSLLTPDSIGQLNAAVDVYHQDPAIAAKQFLQANGLVPPTR